MCPKASRFTEYVKNNMVWGSMKKKNIFKHIVTYLNDQSIDIRIRMLYFLEYASLVVCLIGTIFMVLLKQPVFAMIPNFILFAMSFLGLYFSRVKRKYNLSALTIILGCANIALPWMFFSAGGNESGMQIWFLFGVVITCMMANGKIRIFMTVFTIIEDLACIFIGHFYPGLVTPLVGENAVFFDQVQSFAVVCICLSAILIYYIGTYEKQHQKLEAQSNELRRMTNTDALTGMFNRRAYYEEIQEYKNSNQAGDLVLVAMDVNGLKKVNDQFGHAAGDDYICTAAKVMSQAMGEYGHIFRTGGDEFMAILHCTGKEASSLEERLEKYIRAVEGTWAGKLAVAVGIVCSEEHPDVTISEIEKLADQRMYENKSAYYRKNGIDRRR